MRRAVIFESHPDFSDNSLALYQEFLRRGMLKRYRLYWMKTFRGGEVPELPEGVSVFENEPGGLAETIRRTYVLNTSKYIIDCNSFIYKRRKGQIRIHLGHGMPVKIDLNYSRKFGDCDKYLVLSQFWKEIYTEQILVPEQKLCYLGYPRNDVLVNPPSCPMWKETVADYRRVIVWMPTYRQHRQHLEGAMANEYPYGMPCIYDKEELEVFHRVLCEKNVLVLFRPHPVQELSLFRDSGLTHIRIADDSYLEEFQMTLYELLANSGGLITDYSSVYFDYLLTDQPVALTIEDREEYFQHFTPAFPDYKAFIKGFYVENIEDLTRFIRDTAEGIDTSRTERMRAKEMFHSYVDGRSAKRIADMLENKYGL
ncbi:MAG: hypothetical protein HFG37_03225 [Eubacterium sp.]|nr:hypothetical protein [Eubacterium sp.]MCI9412658.1 hypothetical protein [Eubacterium sp.]